MGWPNFKWPYSRSIWPNLICALLLLNFVSPCPQKCNCNGGIVNCVNKGLTQIPKDIPSNTVRLDLQENQITKVQRNDLAYLKHLKILQLMDNNITTIEANVFDELRNLERLRLNRNLLQVIPEKLFAKNSKLHRL
ncbi:unnamed protein product [Bursaphelenchus okinawaensis]|uniref:LRRNT domain-containing protein n=1 Tax=Bursaphelenchus okinawaensis TaxID=465554 RepID=A0A811KEP3_9BILA|nr:unnamed protein product [Bursaphelenchus okinawaensis]CAG9102316.1 unnamed protein product [Bursaphelenchus okinawaensis]